MKPLQLVLTLSAVLALVAAEAPVSKRPLIFHNWPPKGGQAQAQQLQQLQQQQQHQNGRTAQGKQRTLVVQIRSDQPVPLVLKGRPGQGQHAQHVQHGQHGQHAHAHLHAHAHAPPTGYHHPTQHHLRGPRPLKLSAPVYLKGGSSSPMFRKPLKIKLANTKPKSAKPVAAFEKPFKYEKPTNIDYPSYPPLGVETSQKLPLETHVTFIADSHNHFAPIHTIPAPNLAPLHDNHLHHDDQPIYPSSPKPQPYHQTTTSSSSSSSSSTSSHHDNSQHQYQVIEDVTNDHTILDSFSGSQKLFAPDPDPSLPTSKIRPATEPFNRPSNGRPLPVDVQSNYLPPAQPLVQIVGAQSPAQTKQQQQQHTASVIAAPEIYPIQFTQQAQLQPFVTANIAAVQAAAAPIPIYNPTYLVTQSNNLYTQHKQQLFKPQPQLVEAGYVNADLTQEVASNGQILQAAKDPHNNIHPVLDAAPQFAALIAAPALGSATDFNAFETAPFHLANVAAASTGPEGGFVVSNYYGNAQDSSQLLQAYAEEESRSQQLEAEQATLELQKQQHLQQLQAERLQQQHLQQLQQEQNEQLQLLQQQQNHLHELQQQHFHQQHYQQQQLLPQAQAQQAADPAAFEEHNRLVQQQQLGGDAPLRIFVPDEDSAAAASGNFPRIQKRADNLKRGTVENALASNENDEDSSFEVTSSVEVSSENQRDAESSSE